MRYVYLYVCEHVSRTAGYTDGKVENNDEKGADRFHIFVITSTKMNELTSLL